MEIHPYAEIFPMHTAEAIKEIADDADKRGFTDKIVLYQGKILDGRGRYFAAELAMMTPEYENFEDRHDCLGLGPAELDAKALDFVMSKNLLRRHLTAAHRALAAANYARHKRGRSSKKSDNEDGEGEKETPQIEAFSENTTNAQAAEAFGVTEADVDRAKAILTHGSKHLQKAVVENKVSLSDAAAIVSEPKETQSKAVTLVSSGEHKTLRSAVSEITGRKPKAKKARKKTEEPDGDAHEGIDDPETEPMDMLGNPVPKKCRSAFKANLERLQKAAADLKEVKSTVKAMEKWNHYVRYHEMEARAEELIEDMRNGMPYAVCQDCAGKGKNCETCREVGWIPKWRYEEIETCKQATAS